MSVKKKKPSKSFYSTASDLDMPPRLPGINEYQAHDDLRTLHNAEQIKQDKTRHTQAKKLHASHTKALGLNKKRGR